MPRSGGEYHFLSQIYHPCMGFLSGWASLIVGFAAPVALACMAMSRYVTSLPYVTEHVPWLSSQALAMFMLLLITLFHAFSSSFGTRMQRVLTLCKIAIIVVFILVGLFAPQSGTSISEGIATFQVSDVFTTSFAVSLIWVYYSYSGWNAAAYIIGDIERPRRTVPLALLGSTLFVSVLYVLINYVFMTTTPVAEMSGQVEVGLISALHIFGPHGGQIMGLLLALLLMSSISSMVYVGPRVGQTMGEDYLAFRFLTRKNRRGVPYIAVWVQFSISALMILTDSFEVVTQYTGIIISLFGLLTVAGIFVHRYRFPRAERPYRCLAYPFPPLFFCVVIVWSIVYLMANDIQSFIDGSQSAPWTTIASLLTLLTGVLLYIISSGVNSRLSNDKKTTS